ncbi:aminodeoxychorismate synthase, component I [Paraphotobacterium marinum]|uniref:aminodeoxychorismate synthase n=1 Tax=Paraphotobacterium marinum TaxID=1755811 RepID=A0A220VE52_9GAMM|nr:aminodeoxychorismate synthase component I [Paraphotobacterium marinum]ASK78629.1 aminodeoxychorismate synthase, component I [Paraphotobacterium marinum]
MHSQRKRKIILQELEYSTNISIELFEKFEHIPWSILLKSSGTTECENSNRFDILTSEPIYKIIHKEKTIVSDSVQEKKYSSTECPWVITQNLMRNSFEKVPSIPNIPFCGGAMGYLGYEQGLKLHDIPQKQNDELRIPNFAIGIYDWCIIVDHKLQKCTLVEWDVSKRLTWLRNHLTVSKNKFKLLSKWKSDTTYSSYEKQFEKIKDHLNQGNCYQVNLTHRFSSKFEGDTWSAYLKLDQQNKAPFSSFIRLEDYSILSLSPERFTKLYANRRIETKPIKGTQPRSSDPVIDNLNKIKLQRSEKDRSENLMIVDLMRNDLGILAQPGTVKVSKLFKIESFNAVHHLVSTIQANLRHQYDHFDLLKSIFPGGSITGAPKRKSMEIINELEENFRDIYCGSIGYFSACGQMDTNICIRTLLSKNNMIYVWAGGGIVFDSVLENEYQESFDKLSKILSVLESDETKLY